MQELIKVSDQVTLKAYFVKVRELHKTGEQFPVNLDEVWPLIYSTKQNAFAELKKNFLDGDDYNLMQNHKVVNVNELKNGVKYECKLSVSCLEYFIVRKVREVFEVYRTVFHAAIEKIEKPQTNEEILSSAVLLANRLLAEKDEQINKLAPKAEWTDKVLQSDANYTTTNIAKELGIPARKLNAELCKKKIQYWHDGRYVLYANYENEGYTATRTNSYTDSKGIQHTSMYMVWTERGRAFLHYLFNESLSYGKPAKAKKLTQSNLQSNLQIQA